MRMAIVHDWLDTWRGGETVLAQMCAMYPEARVYALVDFLDEADRRKLGGRSTHVSYLQNVPLARRHFRALLPLFPRAIESLDLSAFDIVLSSSHAVAKGVRTRRDQLHICYCYTPMRYAWDLREQYLQQTGHDRGLSGILARRVLDGLRNWDRDSSERVTDFIAISNHVADRIHRCYGRSSTVIYPPVSLAPFQDTPSRSGVYVTVSQLVPYKRVDLLVAAFAQRSRSELVVIGEGPQRAAIERAAPPNVRLLGRVSDEERDSWLRRARAFLFAAEEDFGIAPLEAQGLGLPVIALGRGGAVETIRGLDHQEPTGVLFAQQTVDGIVAGLEEFERNAHRITAHACRRNAERFSVSRFRAELGAFVHERVARAAVPLCNP